MSRWLSLSLAAALALAACSRSNEPAQNAPAAAAQAHDHASHDHGGHDHGSHDHAATPAAAPATGQTAAPTATPTAAAGAHGSEGHAHGSPHGGVVMSTPGGHIEARLERSGRLTVWLLDEREQTVSPQGASASARMAVAGAQDVPLAFDAAQNALVGQVPAPTSDHATGIVTVTRAGAAPATLRFTFHLEAGGH